jgi:orotate phosphoribosyltransferase
MLSYQHDFIEYALACGVLKFGKFELKSGRISPYFFNTGLFNTGAQLQKLGEFYAKTLIDSGIAIDVFYGPAYKGIPLAVATASAYAVLTGHDMPFSFNRKEAKDHGEGGLLVGAPLDGRVLIIDDVITAGTSVRESVDIIRTASATPTAVLIALDRQEKGQHDCSAVQEVSEQFELPVIAIVTLTHIIQYLEQIGDTSQLAAIQAYQNHYGI